MAETNLIDSLNDEIKRCKELLGMYQGIPQGAFGAIMIKQDIQRAEKAMAEGDTVEMIKCFRTLQNCE